MSAFRKVDPSILRAFIESSGLSYDENSVSWIFTCPRCNKAKKLYLRKRDGRFVCWRCKEIDGFQGRPEYALSELTSSSFDEVCRFLYGENSVRFDDDFDARMQDFFGDGDYIDSDATEFEIVRWPHDYLPIDHPHAARGADYMRGRGVPMRLQRLYGLRYCPEMQRVFFPIGENGWLYGWQGRLIVPHTYVDDNGDEKEVPKILSSKGVQRDRLLMFADRLKGSQHAIVCEGPVDAIKAHYCGGNVATMGKEIGQRQIELLRKSGVKRIYIALDPDASESIERLVTELYGEIELFNMVPQKLGQKLDLGAMSFEEVYQLFLGAERFSTRLFIDINFS